MRARGWDLALQAYGDNPVANDVTSDAGARLTGGFAPTRGPARGSGLHLPYPHALHEADRHLRLLEHLGLPPGASRALEWPVRPEDAVDDRTASTSCCTPGRPARAGAGRSSASRRWRTRLAADGLTGGGRRVPSEAVTTAAVVAAMRAPAVDLTGRTSLGQYAVLLRDAAVVVANDTGTAHLTAAVGGRVVTVFLSGDPVRWRHAPELQTVVRQEVGCNPCPHLDCPIDFRCAGGSARSGCCQRLEERSPRVGRHPLRGERLPGPGGHRPRRGAGAPAGRPAGAAARRPARRVLDRHDVDDVAQRLTDVARRRC
jgi:ADP-heptose:LPS heptosyltransferase